VHRLLKVLRSGSENQGLVGSLSEAVQATDAIAEVLSLKRSLKVS
jgi:hypothetical protein